MLQFVFPAAIQAGIASGAYEVVRTGSGALIGLARNKATGQFVGHAVKVVVKNSPLAPFVGVADMVMGGVETYFLYNQGVKTQKKIDVGFQETQEKIDVGFQTTQEGIKTLDDRVQSLSWMSGAQMVQNHLGFQGTYRRIRVLQSGMQALQTSITALQASTAIIGVGTVASVALSAANLWQTLKLREEVKQLRLDVRDGFIDLKQALQHEGSEVKAHIDRVMADDRFQRHREQLSNAYEKFREANRLVQTALTCNDANIRNSDLANARQTLSEALAIYNDRNLISETSLPGELRRRECAWVIEQAIAMTYQVQNELSAASDRLSQLQDRIRRESCEIVDRCDSEAELDFLFPEITCLVDRDLVVLESWQNHVDWMRSLSPSEVRQLLTADFPEPETADSNISLEKPPEAIQYERDREKSHFYALRDALRISLQSDRLADCIDFIRDRAANKGHSTLTTANFNDASPLAIANLYHYFQWQDGDRALS